MVEIFSVGTFCFWALIVAELMLLLVFTQYEKGVAALVSIAGFLVAIQFLGGVPIFQFLLAKPWVIGVLILPYFTFGIGWLIFMWRRFVRKRLAEHDELLANFVEEMGLLEGTIELPPKYRAEWRNWVDRTKNYHTGQTIADTPKIRHHKAMAFRWWSLWFFSMLLFFFKDMVVELWNRIYRGLATYLQEIADVTFSAKHIRNNLDVPPVQEDQQRTA